MRINTNSIMLISVCIFLFITSCLIYTSTIQNNIQQRNSFLSRDVLLRRDNQGNTQPKATRNNVIIANNIIEYRTEFSSADNSGGKAVIKPRPNAYEQQENDLNFKRREKIVEMIRHAWQGYRNYTFGANEIRPISRTVNNQNIFGGAEMMATIVDSADTLYLAGLKDEYEEVGNYIRDHFDVNKATSYFSVFEVTIRHVGGFLALHALTNESFYIHKAKSIVDAMLPAFQTATGLPRSLMNVAKGRAINYNWAQGSSILSEVGSLTLEFRYLSQLTGNLLYLQMVENIRDILDKAPKKGGLYANYISPETGQFTSEDVSLGAMGDSFYEYLIKSWIQTGGEDKTSFRMYKEASEALRNRIVYGLSFKTKEQLTYVAEIRAGIVELKMGHLACFAPGMFALEAQAERDAEKRGMLLSYAEELSRTCHAMYETTAAKIGPEMAYFNTGSLTIRKTESGYFLRPESIEGWFYLWRITGKEIYKTWIWDAIMAIDRHCRVPAGFAGLKNVNAPKAGYDDVQQSFFLAETLKYAYLAFADDQLPLNKWVFNTEAHPLPLLHSQHTN